MSSGHFKPAARANSPHRHHKTSPARLSFRDFPDDDNVPPEGRGPFLGLGGLTTVVDSLFLPGTTRLQTDILPFAGLPTSGASTQSTPAGQPTAPAQPSSDTTDSSSSAPSSSSSSTSLGDNTLSSSSSSSSSSLSNPVASSTSPPVLNPMSSSAQATNPITPTISGATPTPSSLNASTATRNTHKGLSGGAVGGIVAVIILAAIAITIFIVRKTLLRRRQNKRNTWSAGVFPKPEQESDMFEKAGSFTASVSPPPVPEKPYMPAAIPMPPPMSYNNPASPASATLQPALGAPAVPLTPASASVAIVRCTFIPSLPDELSISTGEIISVLNEYDDGWALCANERGEQGVVPLECLDRASGSKKSPGMYLGQGTGDWRMSRRASSLIGPGDVSTRY